MDHITQSPHSFHSRNSNLHPEDEQITGIKRDRDEETNENISNGSNGAKGGEITKRRRGRPVGSKNKPKPPITITRDKSNTLTTHVLEVANGCDVIESIAAFSRRRQRIVCTMSGSGTVANVTFRQPASAAVVSFNGIFEILTLSGCFLPLAASPAASRRLTVFLDAGQGRVVGGSVVGELLAAGKVVIMAVSFGNAAYERLPLEDEENSSIAKQGGGGGSLGSPTAVTPQSPLPQEMPQNLTNSTQLQNDGYRGNNGGGGRGGSGSTRRRLSF